MSSIAVLEFSKSNKLMGFNLMTVFFLIVYKVSTRDAFGRRKTNLSLTISPSFKHLTRSYRGDKRHRRTLVYNNICKNVFFFCNLALRDRIVVGKNTRKRRRR